MIRGLLLFISLVIAFTVSAQKDRSFQLWSFNSISVDISQKTSIYTSEKVQYSPAENEFNLKFGDIWLKHEVCSWFEYSGGFRVLRSKNQNGWIEEKRPMVMGTFDKKLKNFKISWANRMEYRLYEIQEDHFRWRQKMDIKTQSLTSFGLQFFVAEETFTKFNSEHTHLARLYAGLQAIDKKHFDMKLYYVLEKNKKQSFWNTADILGLNMSFCL